jgi:hypothetical protein
LEETSHVIANGHAIFTPHPWKVAGLIVLDAKIEIVVTSVSLPLNSILMSVEWGRLVQVSLEPNEITHAWWSQRRYLGIAGLDNSRGKGVIKNDVHPSTVDLINRFPPLRDRTEVLIQ